MMFAVILLAIIACLGLTIFTDWSENPLVRATGLFFAVCCWKVVESIMGG